MRLSSFAVALVLGSSLLTADAQTFSTTNLQLTNANTLRDPYYGYDVLGSLQTITVEHFTSGSAGDVYAFVDLLHGDHADAEGSSSGDSVRAYGEITARLNAAALAGRPLAFGPVRNSYVAVEADLGRGYEAWLTGIGFDLAIPGLDAASMNFFHKDDTFNSSAFQTTITWSRNIAAGRAHITFAGFLDAATTDRDGIDCGAQPQLMVDLAPLLRTRAGSVAVGVEWYFHRNANFSTSEPQLLVKWTVR